MATPPPTGVADAVVSPPVLPIPPASPVGVAGTTPTPADADTNTVTPVGDDTPTRRRDPKSLIWEMFAYEEATNGAKYPKAKCLRCRQTPIPVHINVCGGSTSSMWKHAEATHKELYLKLKRGESIALIAPPPSGPEANGIRRSLAGLPAYTDAEHRDQLVRLVVLSDLTFSFVQSDAFASYVNWLCPQASVPSRTTVARDIHAAYKAHKETTQARLRAHEGKISFTTDIWSGGNNAAFMVITAHWMDPVSFALDLAILDFVFLPGSHTGKAIHDAFVACVYEDWGLEDKVFAITTDNASSNVTFIDLLHQSRGFDKARHIRCWAHVANLAVVEVLEDPVVRAVLERLRNIANHLRGSPQRIHRFKMACEASAVTTPAAATPEEDDEVVPILDDMAEDAMPDEVDPLPEPTAAVSEAAAPTKARSIPHDTPTR